MIYTTLINKITTVAGKIQISIRDEIQNKKSLKVCMTCMHTCTENMHDLYRIQQNQMLPAIKHIITERGMHLRNHITYFFFPLSSSLSGIFFFSIVGFVRERSTGEDGQSRCLRRGERGEGDRLLRFRLGE